MGGTTSKTTDNNGEVNNIIKISPSDDTISRMEIMLVILTSLAAFSVLYQLYKDHKRGITKRVLRDAPPTTTV